MTITDTTAPALDLRGMTDAELLDLYRSDGTAAAAALAEAERRDQAGRMTAAQAARDAILAEGYDAAYAQYLKASEWTRGVLLSELGAKRVTDEMSLWTGSEATAMRYASEELLGFWLYVEPRMSPGRYAKQRGQHARIEREQARDEREATDGHTAGPGLAEPEAGALRRGTTASQAPQAGTGRPVQRGGHSTSQDESTEDSRRDGRAGRPVQRDGLTSEGADMGVIHAARVVARAAETSQRAQAAKAEAPQAPQHDPLDDALAAEIGGPGRIMPGEQIDGEDFTPGDLKFVLDETADFVSRHVACTRAQADVMTLYAGTTYVIKAFPTLGHMLFAGETEACGKTVAMMVTASLCANPLDASGTPYALQSALAAASNAPEQLTPTLYYDEISSVFGRSGLSASRDPIAEILRKGYKAGATRAWSVNRTSESYSIFTPFLMAGLRNAVPRDIRTRCICVIMRAGTPAAYFDAREAEPEARDLAACLGEAAASRIHEIAMFRAKDIHPQLRDRHLEVWEPLFALAYILGGQEWLNRCLAAFRELALAGAAQVNLTPKQKTIRDCAQVTAASDAKFILEGGTAFMGGKILRAELLEMDGRRPVTEQRYRGRTDASVGQLIADALPMASLQITVSEGKRRWGYYADDIAAVWERIRPDDPEDAVIPEEIDPFADDDDDDVLEVHESAADSRRSARGGHSAHGVIQ